MNARGKPKNKTQQPRSKPGVRAGTHLEIDTNGLSGSKMDRILARVKLAEFIFHRTGQMIFVCDLRGRIIRANKEALLHHTGILFEPFDAVFALEVRSAKGGHILFALSEILYQEGSVFNQEVVLRKDTGDRFFLLNVRPLYEDR